MPAALPGTLRSVGVVTSEDLDRGAAEGVAAALKYISGRLSDRVGRKPAILTGYSLAAIGKVKQQFQTSSQQASVGEGESKSLGDDDVDAEKIVVQKR